MTPPCIPRTFAYVCNRRLVTGTALILSAVCLLPMNVEAQRTTTDSFAWIDSLVRDQSRTLGLPGVGVAVVRGNAGIVTRAYGVVDVRTPGSAVGTETPFNIASLTKPFTSLLAMQLVRERKLSLSATASQYLPWLPSQYATITIRQLLQHTSGIARDVRLSNEDDPDAAEYRTRVIASTPSSPPGTRFEYSNTGYTVLGWVLAAIEGAGLDSMFHSRIFGPLDMRQSAYREPIAGNARRAAPHNLVNGKPQPVAYVSGGFGGGGISLSIADLSKFMLAIQRSSSFKGLLDSAWTEGRLANGQTISTTMFGSDASYGFGWFIAQYAGRRVLTHGGGINGYSSMMMHFPAESLTIGVIANARAPVEPILRAIADECFRTTRCRPNVRNGRFADAVDTKAR